MYLINETSWGTASTGSLISLAFPDALFAIPFISDKISGFQFLKANVEIEIRMNGNKFLYGKLIAAWDPAAGLDGYEYLDTASVYSMSSGPHFLMDASQPSVERVTLPYMWWTPSIDIRRFTTGCMGTLDIAVLDPLTYVDPSAASATIPVSVFARFVDVTLDGPIASTSGPTSAPRAHRRACNPLV